MEANGNVKDVNGIADEENVDCTFVDLSEEGEEMEEKDGKEKGLEVEADDDDGWDDYYSDIANISYISRSVTLVQTPVIVGYKQMMHITRGYFWGLVFLVLYAAYFIYAMYKTFDVDNGDSLRLLICTIFGVFVLIRHHIASVLKRLYYAVVGRNGLNDKQQKRLSMARFMTRWVLYAGLFAFVVWALIEEGLDRPDNLRGLPGLCILILICVLCSSNPGLINWHTIVWSFGLQFIFAIATLRAQWGRDAIVFLQDRLNEFFDTSTAAFLFMFGDNYRDLGLTFGILPLAFMMTATMGLLYYVGAMQFIIGVLGRFFSFVLEIHYVESIAVSGGIFVDSLLALVAVRPFLGKATRSELFTMVTSIYASLGGAFLAILKGLGVPLYHIIPAMVISAPATILVCKLMVPENRPKRKFIPGKFEEEETAANPLDAYQYGAISGLVFFGNIVAVTFAFLSALEWIDRTLVWFGEQAGKSDVTIQYIFSYLLYPLALAMGVRPSECRTVAKLLGVRLLAGSLIAFQELLILSKNRVKYEAYMNDTLNTGLVTHRGDDIYLGTEETGDFLPGGIISERSEVITTYSLCGFSSVMSMGIVTASIYAFIPHRREWLARMSFPALFAGNIANCMTGCFASLFYD